MISRAQLSRMIGPAAGVLVGCLLFGLVPGAPPRAADSPSSPPAEKSKSGAESGAVEVRFADNGVLRLVVRQEKLTFVTEYGKLTVPMADVCKITFATRLPEDVARKIQAAIARLASDQFKEREQASAELLTFGARAYPALVEAANSGDGEVRRRAESLLASIKNSTPAELLEIRQHDVLYTKDSKFTGRLEETSLPASSSQFGDVQVKVADMRGLRSLALVEPATHSLNPLPDPGQLMTYAGKFGTKAAFTVTGAANGGTVWGDGPYTIDSSLASAAVHAGVLKDGQTGVVEVEIVMPPPAFNGSTQNGVTTTPYGAFPPGAFRFIVNK